VEVRNAREVILDEEFIVYVLGVELKRWRGLREALWRAGEGAEAVVACGRLKQEQQTTHPPTCYLWCGTCPNVPGENEKRSPFRRQTGADV
jgi:hypothetical protein